MDRFAMLPLDCVSKILSLTSPVDAARSSVMSKGFKSAAGSDIVWETFLPSDLHHIILRSGSSLVYATKKELYFNLCDSPLMLDGGKLSFSLDKRSGKKCYLVAAEELIISWGDNPGYWKWTSNPNSRFSKVANLKSVCWLDIRGKIRTNKLSPTTNYAAYLVFQLGQNSSGLKKVNSVVRFVDHEPDDDAERRAITLQLTPSKDEPARDLQVRRINRNIPCRRRDGWLEVEMGTFNIDEGDDGEVEARLLEITRLHGKSGLIVEGIEFRPL